MTIAASVILIVAAVISKNYMITCQGYFAIKIVLHLLVRLYNETILNYYRVRWRSIF